jgi:basic membrane protein A
MVEREYDRRTILRGTGLAGVAGLAGCVSTNDQGGEPTDTDDTDDTDGTDDTDDSTATPTPEPTYVGMVYALGGLGDKSFNDMAHQGIQQAVEEMPIQFKNLEPEGASDMRTLQRKFAQSSDPDYDLVCCIGFTQTKALRENADSFPDQKFMVVDSVVESDNVANYVFEEQEGSFQVGHMAGLLTTESFDRTVDGTTYQTNGETTVGFVGGKQNAVIDKFEAGYRAGVDHANEDVDVKVAYAGSWSDPAKGKEIALSMYNSGADVVYHAAGGTGVGVFKAAREKQRFAIGVDADQSRSTSYEDVILASMVKRVDTAVYQSVTNVAQDSFQGGSVNALGLEEDGVAAVIGQGYEGELPGAITSAMSDSREAIIAGDIEVPSTPDDL